MRILIIEDEIPAAERLKKLLIKSLPHATILDVIDSVENAILWLQKFDHPDLLLVDVQLADGISFDIFDAIEVKSSIVFTTAFDHYAVKAFRANGLDYLLKPIDPDQLNEALSKHNRAQNTTGLDIKSIAELLQKSSSFKERWLTKLGDAFYHIETGDIAYFYSEDGMSFMQTKGGKRHILDMSITQIVKELDPKFFFQINRGMVVGIEALKEAHSYFNGRMKIGLHPPFESDVIVSRERVNDFKSWLGG